MAKVSVLIPALNERFLAETVDDLLDKATGDVEVIVALDGYWPDPILADRPNLTLIHFGQSRGMRPAINAAAAIAKGQYLMKVDAHCMFTEGYDEVLQADCDVDWLVVPRRVSLDAERWIVKDTGRRPVDYEYLSCPHSPGNDEGLHGKVWRERAKTRADHLIDDNMSFQGSCWFIPTRYFWDAVGPLQTYGYGSFVQEPQEIGLRVWLGGGRFVTNKAVTYAHLHKGKQYGRGYFLSKRRCREGVSFAADYWLNNRWEKRVHDLAWLIRRFAPVPSWPEDWESLWNGTQWTRPINWPPQR